MNYKLISTLPDLSDDDEESAVFQCSTCGSVSGVMAGNQSCAACATGKLNDITGGDFCINCDMWIKSKINHKCGGLERIGNGNI